MMVLNALFTFFCDSSLPSTSVLIEKAASEKYGFTVVYYSKQYGSTAKEKKELTLPSGILLAVMPPLPGRQKLAAHGSGATANEAAAQQLRARLIGGGSLPRQGSNAG
jgi:hypothetical protein